MFKEVKNAILSLPVFADAALSAAGEAHRPWLDEAIGRISLGEIGAHIVETPAGGLCVELPVPLLGFTSQWLVSLGAQSLNCPPIEWVVRVPPPTARSQQKPVRGVKHLIAVASGKGGVGKSTTAVNLALALAKAGAEVGLLDADIYGPSVPLMLGLAQAGHPTMNAEKMLVPHRAHGLSAMSMGFLANENTPMVWRGPMVSGALMQLLHQTCWPSLDYLIVDMPPGTGDIQLTLCQQVPVDGAVIVTTPQDVACLDARKGIEMFRKVQVPVLGVIENMAIFHCPKCGHGTSVFGSDGGQRLAAEYHVPLLGQLPLSADIRLQTDAGMPPVASALDSPEAQCYVRAAASLALACHQHRGQVCAPNITVLDD